MAFQATAAEAPTVAAVPAVQAAAAARAGVLVLELGIQSSLLLMNLVVAAQAEATAQQERCLPQLAMPQ